jgi:hypothetical protein
MALIKTLKFGGTEEHSGALGCVLNDGWVNAKYVEADVLRTALEKDAAAINCSFDFVAWAQDHGFASKGNKKKKR